MTCSLEWPDIVKLHRQMDCMGSTTAGICHGLEVIATSKGGVAVVIPTHCSRYSMHNRLPLVE